MTPQQALEDLLPNFAGDLVNSDETITGMMAGTNATFWGLDVFDDLELTEVSPTEYDFSVELTLSGDQEEKPFCGDQIVVTVTGKLVNNTGKWRIEEYNLVEPELNW